MNGLFLCLFFLQDILFVSADVIFMYGFGEALAELYCTFLRESRSLSIKVCGLKGKGKLCLHRVQHIVCEGGACGLAPGCVGCVVVFYLVRK